MRICLNPIRHNISASCSSSTPLSAGSGARVYKVGKRWKEYHGAHSWDGLLDPVDDTLRRELIRYGKFVQATYNSFNFDPSSPSYAACRFARNDILPLSGLKESGYEVTCNLLASSGIQLPSWVEIAPSWVSTKTSWIGYVAVCQDEDEIARLGRRDIVVALRGTVTCLEWLENLRATLTDVSGGEKDVMVERGFWSLYTSAGQTVRSLQDQIRDELCRLVEAYGREEEPLSITMTGHSLGAALAVLAAQDTTANSGRQLPPVAVISFGGPRVGNSRFRREVEEKGSKVLRIVNTRDIVTKVPGFVLDGPGMDGVDGDESGWLPSWVTRAGLAYSDVGQELRVCCQNSSVAACHDLDVYLQLVNQLSSTCPFRGRLTEGEGNKNRGLPRSLPIRTSLQ